MSKEYRALLSEIQTNEQRLKTEKDYREQMIQAVGRLFTNCITIEATVSAGTNINTDLKILKKIAAGIREYGELGVKRFDVEDYANKMIAFGLKGFHENGDFR